MALKSMTGFGRADGGDDRIAWHWEIRTVNGRGRDLRFRMPPGFEDLEPPAREMCAQTITRGNCTINLQIKRHAGATEIVLNEAALTQVLGALDRAQSLAGSANKAKDLTAPARLDGLLGLRGVLEAVEPAEDENVLEARRKTLLDGLSDALAQVTDSRVREGARLEAALTDQISRIAALTETAKNSPARQPDVIAARLKDQIARLAEDSGLDQTRLYQEAVLIATRADIEEEIERLEAHCAAARAHLGADTPVGRRLEFLTQEFNREANTLCAKSNDPALTQTGLEMKAIIDQMREQVQNIE